MRRVAGDAYGVRYSRRFGGLSLKTTGWIVSWVCPQNSGEVPRRNEAARGGITDVASRRSKSVQEAWPSDQQKLS